MATPQTNGDRRTKPHQFGNLSEAREDQLNSLVDKWYGGLDRPTNYVSDSAAELGALAFDYSEMTGDLFVDGINFDDINQGQAGTCYLLAAACSLQKLTQASLPRCLKTMETELWRSFL